MPNAVLERLVAQRQEQITFIDQTLERVEAEGRDLVEAETHNLEAARQRIRELTDQIEPIEDFERLRSAHNQTAAGLPRPDRLPATPRAVDAASRELEYRSVGEFVVDHIRARGVDGVWAPDPAAQQRIAAVRARAVSNQTTANTPGILPTPIVGPVVNLIDANRPLISSLGGARALGGIPGTTFTRPKITQHVTVGPQAGEKTQLPSQNMVINPVTFTKATYGGTVDISRQDMDWTSPAAWDILVRDLADVYAIQTETAVAAAFKAAAAGTAAVVAANTLAGWTLALYTAAMHSYQAGLRMPDRLWCSLDVWAALGSLVDATRVVLPPDSYSGAVDTPIDSFDIGGSSLASFRGDMLGVPRIVVPTFPAGTAIVGPSNLYEVYEDIIGLLSVVEPSILGVQVAYGGYTAWGTLAGAAFVPLTPPAGLPSMIDPEELAAADEPVKASSTSKKA